jgi:hypothetical protein
MMLKTGVDIKGIGTEISIGLRIVEGVLEAHGAKCLVTSCRDGKHMQGSKHGWGDAVDIRLASRWVTTANVDLAVLNEARANLGDQFDLVLESDHFHLEFDPRKDLTS